MFLKFHKYQGTGNDFIILDNRKGEFSSLNTEQINFLCNRRFGIGADGLMLLNSKQGYDFEMKYFNADGRESSMCGNGGRCLVKFAYHLGIHKNTYLFDAIDGNHEAEIDLDGTVSLKMKDVPKIRHISGDYIIDTGSPHYIKMVSDLDKLDVFKDGRSIRNSNLFKKEGINVNFVEQVGDDEIAVRTYERGVEDETLSCGTGVTAAALACYHNETGFNDVMVNTKGGKLNVEYDRLNNDSYSNIWLSGPAEKVFEGEVEIEED
ncbi:MAG: diaminopimelate epimerase [Chitinophagaceae bacterium]|nr:MAG: diaminopimelate epimerase [Chitinophagaceae bacterium]